MWTEACPEFDLDPDEVHDTEVLAPLMTLLNHADCVIVGAGIAGLVTRPRF